MGATEHVTPRQRADASDRDLRFEAEALTHLEDLHQQAVSLTGGNEARAQDLVQETLLKAYQSWDSYETGTNCRGWLMTILRNKFITEFRKRKRRPSYLAFEELPDRSVLEDPEAADPAATFYESLIADDVVEALDDLPDRFRVAVILSDLRDWQYQEISDELGIPVGTVKSRLSRARGRLRERLRSYARQKGFAA